MKTAYLIGILLAGFFLGGAGAGVAYVTSTPATKPAPVAKAPPLDIERNVDVDSVPDEFAIDNLDVLFLGDPPNKRDFYVCTIMERRFVCTRTIPPSEQAHRASEL